MSGGSYQARSALWMGRAFASDPTDREERRDRFAEEALEVVHALGLTRDDAHRLVEYVYGREIGWANIEIGQAVFTLACLADVLGVDMMRAAETELTRCDTPEFIAKLARKRSTRHGRGPLPGLSGPGTSAPASVGRSPKGRDDEGGSAREDAVGEAETPKSDPTPPSGATPEIAEARERAGAHAWASEPGLDAFSSEDLLEELRCRAVAGDPIAQECFHAGRPSR